MFQTSTETSAVESNDDTYLTQFVVLCELCQCWGHFGSSFLLTSINGKSRETKIQQQLRISPKNFRCQTGTLHRLGFGRIKIHFPTPNLPKSNPMTAVSASTNGHTSMFSMVNRSPRLCRAFPPTATTNRFFFCFLSVLGADGVAALAASALGAVEKKARRASPARIIAWR